MKNFIHKPYNYGIFSDFKLYIAFIAVAYALYYMHEYPYKFDLVATIYFHIFLIAYEIIVILEIVHRNRIYNHHFEFTDIGFIIKGPFIKTQFIDYSEYPYVGQYRWGRMIHVVFSKENLSPETLKNIEKKREKKEGIFLCDCVLVNIDPQMKDLPIIDFLKEKYNLEIDINNTIVF